MIIKPPTTFIQSCNHIFPLTKIYNSSSICVVTGPSPNRGSLKAPCKEEFQGHREAIQHDCLLMDTVHDS